MCTVTWWRQPSFYEVFFNRDELRSRKPGLPPKIEQQEGVRYLAPADGNYGGTWIWVNEHRLTVCLLNHYPAHSSGGGSKADPARASRGHLLRSLASSCCLDDLYQRLEKISMEPYRPFYLVGLEPDQSARQWTWDGCSLDYRQIEEKDLPLTTSSYRTEEIVKERANKYHRRLTEGMAPDRNYLRNFHYCERANRSAFSVCMEREDALTLSLSRITVNRSEIVFSYRDRVSNETDFKSEAVKTVLSLDPLSR